MRPIDFFREQLTADGWAETVLNRDLIAAVTKGELSAPDADVAAAILELLRSELEAYANGHSNRIKDDRDIELVFRAARMACKRTGVQFPDLPFRNLSTWMAHWRKEGLTGAGSWQARRDHLAALFGPAYRDLETLQLRALDEELSQGISPWGRTGWRAVDGEIAELRRRFDVARSAQDYSAVGTACVRVLEAVGDAVYDPQLDLRAGEPHPPRDRTKDRLGRAVVRSLGGSGSADLRRLVTSAITVSHRVKHQTTPTRREAGMAADAAILVAHLLRRATEA